MYWPRPPAPLGRGVRDQGSEFVGFTGPGLDGLEFGQGAGLVRLIRVGLGVGVKLLRPGGSAVALPPEGRTVWPWGGTLRSPHSRRRNSPADVLAAPPGRPLPRPVVALRPGRCAVTLRPQLGATPKRRAAFRSASPISSLMASVCPEGSEPCRLAHPPPTGSACTPQADRAAVLATTKVSAPVSRGTRTAPTSTRGRPPAQRRGPGVGRGRRRSGSCAPW